MNPKQCKRIRKQLGYKPQNLAGSLSEDQLNLKKEYKNKKRSYKPSPQVRQLAFEAASAVRKAKALAEKAQANVHLEAQRATARAERRTARVEKRAARLTEVNPLIAAGAERKRKHAERQAILEATENAFRKNLQREELLAREAAEKVRLEKKKAKLALALKNSEQVVNGQSA